MMTAIHQKTTRLSAVSQGSQVKLDAIHVGRGLTSRLTSLGLTPGVEIQVIQNYGRGPIIIKVRGTHVALGRGEADQLLVQPVEEE